MADKEKGKMKRKRVTVDFDDESFEKLVGQIQCYSCKDVPGPEDNLRYKCHENGHSLCEGCCTKVAVDSDNSDYSYDRSDDGSDDGWLNCQCGSEVSTNPCKLTQTLLESIPWYCRNFKRGCREMFQGETELSDHQDECIYREIRCCDQSCDQEILFKDYLDHLEGCLKRRPVRVHVHKSAEIDLDFPVCSSHDSINDICFVPDRIEAHGNTFFFICTVDNDYYRMWMLMLIATPCDSLDNFEWNLKVIGDGKEEFTFRGEPFPIDKHYKDVLKEQNGFSIGIKKAVEIRERLGKFQVAVEIRNLKEEAKDKDMDSEVPSDENDE